MELHHLVGSRPIDRQIYLSLLNRTCKAPGFCWIFLAQKLAALLSTASSLAARVQARQQQLQRLRRSAALTPLLQKNSAVPGVPTNVKPIRTNSFAHGKNSDFFESTAIEMRISFCRDGGGRGERYETTTRHNAPGYFDTTPHHTTYTSCRSRAKVVQQPSRFSPPEGEGVGRKWVPGRATLPVPAFSTGAEAESNERSRTPNAGLM